jgi:excinuclease ABC subunit B
VDAKETSGGGVGTKRRKSDPRGKARAQAALERSPLFNTGEDSAAPEDWAAAVENNAAGSKSRIVPPSATSKERKLGEWAVTTKAAAQSPHLLRPHKPTLDEMGPHAERPMPGGKPKPARPAPDLRTLKPGKTIVVGEEGELERRGKRRRPVKTGRPGT